jgi:hypothetical protein
LLLWIASLALAMTNLEVAYAALCPISERLFYASVHARHDLPRGKFRWRVPGLGHCHTALQYPPFLHLQPPGKTT